METLFNIIMGNNIEKKLKGNFIERKSLHFIRSPELLR